ncbi:phosphate acyltransferase PlsX [bacterium D16-76]|nr:phosphate acyltransferase PlsX [bacterium D16-76]
MRIIVDGFGGDNAPGEILLGCAQAMDELGVGILLTGDKARLEAAARERGLEEKLARMEVLPCGQVLSMEDEPTSVIKEKADSSMAVGLRALAEGRGDAFASAGNSGAMVVGATTIVKRIRGVKRVTFAPILPKSQGFFMLSDGGANVDCRPEMLVQFGLMGSVYMEKVMGVKKPRVGLCNVGSESHKGDDLRRQAYGLLTECKGLHFTGNVEPRELPYDGCDVAVADGFTGNMLLKMYEGVALALMDQIKGVMTSGLKNKLAAAVLYSDMKQLKKHLDYNEYGGAPIMGAQKPVFKIHGSAKASTVKNALRLTRDYTQSGIIGDIARAVGKKDNL